MNATRQIHEVTGFVPFVDSVKPSEVNQGEVMKRALFTIAAMAGCFLANSSHGQSYLSLTNPVPPSLLDPQFWATNWWQDGWMRTNTIFEPSGAQRSGPLNTNLAELNGIEVPTTFYLGPKLNELSGAVQATIRQQSQGQSIEDIDREKWNDRAVYEVEFKQEGGNRRIHIAEDGSLVKIDEMPSQGVPTISNANTGTLNRTTTPPSK